MIHELYCRGCSHDYMVRAESVGESRLQGKETYEGICPNCGTWNRETLEWSIPEETEEEDEDG